MRYLIVGGTSIFGEGLVDRLLKKENTDIIFATYMHGENTFEKEKLCWQELDLRDVKASNKVIEDAQVDVIFDFATQDSVGYAWENPTETVDTNVIGTINLLNAVRDYSPSSRLVIGGSGEEYGRLSFSELPAKEDTTINPINIYGATKACQTMFAKLYHQAFGLDIVIVRTFYEISSMQDDNFAVSSFCKQFAEIKAGKREPVIYAGNLNNIRDFTDVDDLVRAFELVAEKGKSGEIYNAARGQAVSLMDIISILEEITGIKVTIIRDPNRVRPMDAPSAYADVSKIFSDTGWKAEISIEQTIERILLNRTI